MRGTAVTAALTAAVLLLAGCTSDGGSEPSPEPSKTDRGSPSATGGPSAPGAKGTLKVVRTVTDDLDSPWGLAPLPGGDLLVSSRDTGEIRRVSDRSGKAADVGSVPGVAAGGEGGLLGIAVPRDFDRDRMVYAYLTTESDNRIVRMTYDPKKPAGKQLGAPDTVLRGIPRGTVHNGGRIAFGPDGMLYAGTGESGDGELSQDASSPAGKILRMTPEGEPAPGNPEKDSVVYSLGHRNVQGLAWDSEKRLWASEFGQDTWDELNLIRPGRNYGWPEAEGKAGERGFTDPLVQWRPSEASPSGIAFAAGSVWVASLRGERLWRVPLTGSGTKVRPAAEPQAFLEGKYGRLRTVVAAGRDRLWVVTSDTDGRGSVDRGDDRILLVEVT